MISAAFQAGEAVERKKNEVLENVRDKVGEFRKRLRISEVKGGPDGGLGRVGQTLSVTGWVRTLRVQSSVTFVEVK